MVTDVTTKALPPSSGPSNRRVLTVLNPEERSTKPLRNPRKHTYDKCFSCTVMVTDVYDDGTASSSGPSNRRVLTVLNPEERSTKPLRNPRKHTYDKCFSCTVMVTDVYDDGTASIFRAEHSKSAYST
jgi:DNA-directed RNA polymerase subunit N (RpoN/RPB10)